MQKNFSRSLYDVNKQQKHLYKLLDLSLISNDVYDDDHHVRSELLMLGWYKHTLPKTIASSTGALYLNIDTRQSAIAFSGTHKIEDLKQDLAIVVRKIPSRLNEAMSFVKKIFDYFKTNLIEQNYFLPQMITGHSLGGALTQLVVKTILQRLKTINIDNQICGTAFDTPGMKDHLTKMLPAGSNLDSYLYTFISTNSIISGYRYGLDKNDRKQVGHIETLGVGHFNNCSTETFQPKPKSSAQSFEDMEKYARFGIMPHEGPPVISCLLNQHAIGNITTVIRNNPKYKNMIIPFNYHPKNNKNSG